MCWLEIQRCTCCVVLLTTLGFCQRAELQHFPVLLGLGLGLGKKHRIQTTISAAKVTFIAQKRQTIDNKENQRWRLVALQQAQDAA